jgi:hypothetical protein
MPEARSVSNSLILRPLWWLDTSVLLALATLIFYTVSKHEPWADEAQAWLLARDFPWWRLIFSELRYEGHPALWFAILYPAIHLFHLPYAYLGYLAGSLAVAGLALLLFLAPFPRLLRYLIAFSFFFVYQYAVLARPYVLMPLLGFLAAYFYRKGLPRITPFAVTLALLLQVSSYAAIIAFSLAVAYALPLVSRWKDLTAEEQKRVLRAAALVAFSALLLLIVLFPPADSFLVAQARSATFTRHLQLLSEGLVGAFSDSVLVTILLLVLAGLWAYQRSALLLLILSVGGTALEYGFVRGYSQHQGLITIAFVVFLWVAWPSAEQLEGLTGNSKSLQQALLVALVLTFAWHCTWSYSAIRNDWAGPYTGATDAARFLKSVHADERGCNGFGFWAVGVQPYFDRNIFLNYGGPDAPASQHWSIEFYNRANVLSLEKLKNRPRYLLVADEESLQQVMPMIEGFKTSGYELIHYSDGTKFFKNELGAHSLYLIFERVEDR